jgi:hypothetical protein
MAIFPWSPPRALQSQSSPLAQLRARDSARLSHYRDLWEFYSNKHYQARRGRTNLQMNYARAIVDKGLGYLFARGITFSVEANQTTEDALADYVRTTRLLRTLLQAGTNASVLGDAVLKVFLSAQGRLRVLNIDPSNVFPSYAGDDPEELLSLSVASTLSPAEAATRYGAQASRNAELLETWTPTSYRLELSGEVLSDAPNPYGFIPFIHVANLAPPGSVWGQSDLEDVIPLNRELDLRMSDQADVIRYHADPPVIFTGVEEHSALPVGPGTVWDVPRDAKVSLLEWTGQTPAVDAHLARVMTALHDLSESPRTTFGETSQAFSGVALEAQSQPIVQRTLRKRIVWEPALERIAEYLLRLAEQFGLQPDRRTTFFPYLAEVIWAPMLPIDDAAQANRELALVAGGLKAPTTAMGELGELDPDAELALAITQREQLGLNAATPAERGTQFATTP